MTFRQEARWHLEQDLIFGKKVGNCTLGDLIECELDQRFQSAAREVSGLLTTEEPDRSLFISRFHDRLIKEYLDGKEDLIAELAVEMAEDYATSQGAQEYA